MPLQEAAEAYKRARVEEARARGRMRAAEDALDAEVRAYDKAQDAMSDARRALIEAAEVDE